MTKMLKQVIHEESAQYPFYPGEIHKWTFKGKKKIKCAMLKAVPKMLVMLSLGVSYRFAKTGQEENLADMIKYHPPRSLYPHDIFRMSYRLNKGNIYLTILTIENLLSRHWTDINREARMVTNRLAHITNDPHGDNFGTWYHLWGVTLFGYLHGSATAWTVGTIEGLGSSLMSGFKAEVQENKVNRLGARVGGRLKKAFRKKRSTGLDDFIPSNDYTDPKKYLNLLEHDCKRNKKGSR